MNRDSPDPTPDEPGTPPTILVIEDDAAVRDFFIKALQFAGLEVAEAWSAEVALGLMRAGLIPDAVLLDLSMPGMGGWAFLRELRSEPLYCGIPVAIITGHLLIQDEMHTMATEFGVAIHYKPLSLDQLLALTSALLELRAS